MYSKQTIVSSKPKAMWMTWIKTRFGNCTHRVMQNGMNTDSSVGEYVLLTREIIGCFLLYCTVQTKLEARVRKSQISHYIYINSLYI